MTKTIEPWRLTAISVASLVLAALPGLAQPAAPLPAGWVSTAQLTEVLQASPAQGAGSKALAKRSAVWRRQLLGAEAAGDALASWVLRFCASAPHLDRTGLDSTCSHAEPAVGRAVDRLLALGLGPAFDRAARSAARRIATDEPLCNMVGNVAACPADMTARWLAVRLAEAEASAVVQPLNHDELPRCPRSADSQGPSADDVECLRLWHHLQAMRTLARQHIRLSYSTPADEAERAAHGVYAEFKPVEEDKAPRRGGDVSWSPHDEATERFYEAVLRSLHTMQQNLRLRLLQDSRWSAFVSVTPPMLERVRHLKAMPQVREKHVWRFQKHRQQMRRYVGRYFGSNSGNSRLHVETWLDFDVEVFGGFAFVTRYADDFRLSLGRLSACMAGEPDELICVWRDRYGVGLVSMVFNADATGFDAEWTRIDAGRNGFTRMEPGYHRDGSSTWNGQLQ